MEDESNIETTSYQCRDEDRGGGGKLRRPPPSRKPPSTPYSRPPSRAAADGERRRWLSKLVDPACRLISGGASLFFPSFFSAPPPSASDDGDHDKLEAETEEQHRADDHNCSGNHEISRATGVEGSTRAMIASESVSDLVGQKQETKLDTPDEKGLSKPVEKEISDIELLLKGKNFSRDEVNRLIDIINSRAVEIPKVEQEKKYQSLTVGEPKGPVTSHEITNLKSEKIARDLHGSLWQNSTPLRQSVILDDVGASPIDIAKAYMGSRRESGNISKGMIPQDDRSLLYGSNPMVSPSPKPSAYWPGSMVKDPRDYLTPQPQRGRFGLHNFPRTPYSRTIFSKSNTKVTQLQGDNDKWPNLTPYSSVLRAETPIFGQKTTRSDAVENDYASVGPIRRSRHKLGSQTPFSASKFIGSSLAGPSKLENSNHSHGFLPAIKKNFEPGATSSSSRLQSADRTHSFQVGVPTVHPQTSRIARTILEHIDRNPPTPKDKLEELKLAASWKEPTSLSKPSLDPNGPQKSAQATDDCSNSLFKARSQENRAKGVNSASNLPHSNVFLSNGGNGTSQTKSSHEDITKNAASSQVPNLQKKPPTSGNKPVLSSITIAKPVSNWKFSSDQSFGFTFPVTTTSGALSDPPTPSIMPSLSASTEKQPKDGPDVPTYTFGSAKSEPGLVFSFPSTSSSGSQNDNSDIKFSFGSDKPRLSFSSVGKDAICY